MYGFQARDNDQDTESPVESRAETGSKFWTRVLDRCYPPRTRVRDSMATFPSGIYHPRNTHAIIHV